MKPSIAWMFPVCLVAACGASGSSMTPVDAGGDDRATPVDVAKTPDVAVMSDATAGSDVTPPRDAIDVTVRDVTLTPDVAPDAPLDVATDAPGDTGTPRETAIRVRYPSMAGRTMALRGEGPGLSWERGVTLPVAGVDTWVWRSSTIATPFAFKPMLDDRTWSRGPNYTVQPGQTVEVTPRFTTAIGAWSRRETAFASRVLGNTRGIWVYLPPTYDENTLARFPVVYMHDGQNLFDPRAAFGGQAWNVQDAMNAGAEDGTIREAIVVGVENTAARIDEYTPTRDATEGAGGRGPQYLQFLVTEVKPWADRTFRTMPGAEDTALVGSSLGGLISAWGGVHHPDVFALIGAMSPSTWWDNRMLLGDVDSTMAAPHRPLRVYVDSGDAGPSMDGVTDTAELAMRYRRLGYRDGVDLQYTVQRGAQHNEFYWAQRLPGALRFLLGPRR